jgi:hypothetical protein
MAHFAKINTNNIVEKIIAIDNNDCCGKTFPDSEICGQNFIQSLGLDGTWKQTSYNNSFRKKYAGIGFSYDQNKDIFISPKPFDSWVFDNTEQDWVAPLPFPNDGNKYDWNENDQEWVLLEDNL